jgi:hypothetical protein
MIGGMAENGLGLDSHGLIIRAACPNWAKIACTIKGAHVFDFRRCG